MSKTDGKPPYAQWLGRPAVGHISNLYELLGLTAKFQDREIIAQVADGLIQRVQSIDPGPHAKAQAQLLVKLKHARSCLTDPLLKTEYDTQLSTVTTPEEVPRAVPVARPAASWTIPPPIPPTIPIKVLVESASSAPQLELRANDRRASGRCRHRSSWAAWIAPGIFLVITAILIFVLLATQIGQRMLSDLHYARHAETAPGETVPVKNTSAEQGVFSETVAINEDVQQQIATGTETVAAPYMTKGHKPAGETTVTAPITPDSVNTGQNPPITPNKPTDANSLSPVATSGSTDKHASMPVPAEQITMLSQHLRAARNAMRRRHWDSANTSLASAHQITPNGPLGSNVIGLKSLLAGLRSFWKAINVVMETLEPGSDIPNTTPPALVVHSNKDRIAILVEGSILRYTPENMPIELAVSLSEFYRADAPDDFALATGIAVGIDTRGGWEKAEQFFSQNAVRNQLQEIWEKDYEAETWEKLQRK